MTRHIYDATHAEYGLRSSLPYKLYELFDATCGQPSTGVTTFSGDGQSLTQEVRLRFFSEVPRPAVPATGRAVDRLIVRETLLAGLDDAVQFGNAFTVYELHRGPMRAGRTQWSRLIQIGGWSQQHGFRRIRFWRRTAARQRKRGWHRQAMGYG